MLASGNAAVLGVEMLSGFSPTPVALNETV
jgi:hypothetical protein